MKRDPPQIIPLLAILILGLHQIPVSNACSNTLPCQPLIQDPNTHLTYNLSIVFQNVQKTITMPGYTYYLNEQTKTNSTWLTHIGDIDEIIFYLTSTNQTNPTLQLVGEYHYYFTRGTLNLIGLGINDQDLGLTMQLEFYDEVNILDTPGTHKQTVHMDYYDANYNLVESEDVDIYTVVGSSDSTTVNIADHGPMDVQINHIKITIDWPFIQNITGATTSNITLLEGDYSTDIGALVSVNLLDWVNGTMALVSGYTPSSTTGGEKETTGTTPPSQGGTTKQPGGEQQGGAGQPSGQTPQVPTTNESQQEGGGGTGFAATAIMVIVIVAIIIAIYFKMLSSARAGV